MNYETPRRKVLGWVGSGVFNMLSYFFFQAHSTSSLRQAAKSRRLLTRRTSCSRARTSSKCRRWSRSPASHTAPWTACRSVALHTHSTEHNSQPTTSPTNSHQQNLPLRAKTWGATRRTRKQAVTPQKTAEKHSNLHRTDTRRTNAAINGQVHRLGKHHLQAFGATEITQTVFNTHCITNYLIQNTPYVANLIALRRGYTQNQKKHSS